MRVHRIGVRNSQYPNLITESMLEKIIALIKVRRRRRIKMEFGSVIDIPYFKYLTNMIRSNPEYVQVFDIVQTEEQNNAEIVLAILKKQFEILLIDGKKCFDKVELITKGKCALGYIFICSSEFYWICHEKGVYSFRYWFYHN